MRRRPTAPHSAVLGIDGAIAPGDGGGGDRRAVRATRDPAQRPGLRMSSEVRERRLLRRGASSSWADQRRLLNVSF